MTQNNKNILSNNESSYTQENFDSVCIPHNVAELLKDFNNPSSTSSDIDPYSQSQPLAHEIDTAMSAENMSEWGILYPCDMVSHYETNETIHSNSIVLNDKVMAHLNNNPQSGTLLDREHQERTADILEHALEPGAYGSFSHFGTQTGITTETIHVGRRISNDGSFSNELHVKDYLKQILLPVDSFAESEVSTDITGMDLSPFDYMTQDLSSQNAEENTLDTDAVNIVDDFYFLQVDEMLQNSYETFMTPQNYSMDLDNFPLEHGTTHSLAFASHEDTIKTNFFSFYDEKSNVSDTIMWDSPCDSFDIYGTSFLDDNMDYWDEFNIEKDWVDLSFYLDKGYTFEIISERNDSIIAIKNTDGTIIQTVNLKNTKVEYSLINAMQEHIQNPISDNTLSFGKCFGIFAIDSTEPWFSKIYGRPDPIEFLRLQEELQKFKIFFEDHE